MMQQQRTRSKSWERDSLSMTSQMKYWQITELNLLLQKTERGSSTNLRSFSLRTRVKHIREWAHLKPMVGRRVFFDLMKQKSVWFRWWVYLPYNYVKPHMSLNFDELEIHHQTFLRGYPLRGVWLHKVAEMKIISGYHIFGFLHPLI
jgi:hypothetical protein